jgi:hypothetical protein
MLINDVSTLKDDVSALKVGQNRPMEDVSILKAQDSLLAVVSDTSLIKVDTISRVARISIDIEKAFSDSFMQDEEGKIALAWDKYEE